MVVELTPSLESFIKEKLANGEFHSAIDVLEEAVGALSIRDRRVSELKDVQNKILVGLQQADRGEFSDMTFEDVKVEGRRRANLAK